MAASEIRIVHAYVEALVFRATQTTTLLEETSSLARIDFPGNKDVDDEFARFLSRWDRHRGDLRDGMTTVSTALQATSDAFDRVENELVSAVQSGGGRAL